MSIAERSTSERNAPTTIAEGFFSLTSFSIAASASLTGSPASASRVSIEAISSLRFVPATSTPPAALISVTASWAARSESCPSMVPSAVGTPRTIGASLASRPPLLQASETRIRAIADAAWMYLTEGLLGSGRKRVYAV